jgi:hypothetical protein
LEAFRKGEGHSFKTILIDISSRDGGGGGWKEDATFIKNCF